MEREQNPDWRNPGALTQSELSALSALLGRGALLTRDFERVDSAGTVMLIAQDSGDLIVGYMSMTFAMLLGRKKAYVNEVILDGHSADEILRAAAAICDEAGIHRDDVVMSYVQHKPARHPGLVGWVKSVERLEHSFDTRPEAPDDGPATSQLRAPPRAGND